MAEFTVCAETADCLPDGVTKFMKLGWVVHGPMMHVGTTAGSPLYAQAMIKPKQEEESKMGEPDKKAGVADTTESVIETTRRGGAVAQSGPSLGVKNNVS